jgi:hypothetical protein
MVSQPELKNVIYNFHRKYTRWRALFPGPSQIFVLISPAKSWDLQAMVALSLAVSTAVVRRLRL